MKKTKKKTKIKSDSALCSKCGALCCRYVAIEIDKPTTKGDFEDVRWYLSHRDVWVFVDEGDWYVCVERPCRFLSKDNKCKIYDERPRICRRYTTVNCEFHDQDKAFEMKFMSPEDLREYADEYFRLQRAKYRARIRRLRAR